VQKIEVFEGVAQLVEDLVECHPALAGGSFATAAARQRLAPLDLFARLLVDGGVAEVDLAVHAGVGALQAGVVGLYGVVMILRRWVRGCARLWGVHKLLLMDRASGRLGPPRRLPTLLTAVLSHVCIEESIHLG
jgi:hypothetical protein